MHGTLMTTKKRWVVHNKEATRLANMARYRREAREEFFRATGFRELPEGYKQCRGCRKAKPLSDFYQIKYRDLRRGGKSHRSRCIACEAISNRSQRESSRGREYQKNYRLLCKFGITLDKYREMLAEQCGMCAICGKTKADDTKGHDLSVDHDHATGKVRGLLCRHCNVAIGKLGDSVEGLMRAVNYLKKHQEIKDAA